MSSPCPDREQLTGYALGALAPHDEQSLYAHLKGCGRCSAELDRLTPAVALLAESVEQLEPPAELRERLLEVVNREADRQPGPRRAFRGGLGLLLRPAIGLVAAAMIVAGAAGYLIHSDSGPTRTVPLSGALAGAGGSLEIEDGVATLTASGIPTPSAGEIYQVWVRTDQVLAPVATFVPHQDGTAMAAAEIVPGGREVLITREPRAGRTSPTQPTLLSASLVD